MGKFAPSIWLSAWLAVSYERLLSGKQFRALTDRSWPVASRNGRYLEARAAGQIGVFNTSKFGGPGQPTVTTLSCP
jgi:hypothetical protein